MIAGIYFVTPHAVKQFRKRMAWRLTYEQAQAEIIKGLKNSIHSRKDNYTWAQIIRVKGKWSFRAVIRGNVVVTILRG